MLIVAVVLLFPVINYPILKEVDTLISSFTSSDILESHAPSTWVRHRHIIVCAVVFATIVLLNVCIPNLSLLFGLCGSIGLSMVSFVLPAAMYIFHCPPPQATQKTVRDTAGAACVLVVGLVMLFGSTTAIIRASV